MGRRIVEVVVGSGVVMEEEEGRGEGARGEKYGREEMRDGSYCAQLVRTVRSRAGVTRLSSAGGGRKRRDRGEVARGKRRRTGTNTCPYPTATPLRIRYREP